MECLLNTSMCQAAVFFICLEGLILGGGQGEADNKQVSHVVHQMVISSLEEN